MKPRKYDLVLWNQLNPVGSPCVLTMDNGDEIRTKTRTGCQMLERLKMLETRHP